MLAANLEDLARRAQAESQGFSFGDFFGDILGSIPGIGYAYNAIFGNKDNQNSQLEPYTGGWT